MEIPLRRGILGIIVLLPILVIFTIPNAAKADTWTVCNKTADEVKVAIAYNLKDQRQYISNGWWSIPANGGCKNVLAGNLPIRGVFLRGESPHRTWEGDTLFCVLHHGELPEANLQNDKQCTARGGTMRAFAMTVLSAAQYTTTLTPRAPAHQSSGFGNDVMSCAANAPCFQAVYQKGSDLIFEFNGVVAWDVYNVRYPDGTQFENKSGVHTVHNVKPNHTYQISVQGCNTHVLAHSTCTAWVSQKFTTK